MIFNLLNKYTKSKDPEINKAFVNDIIEFLFKKLKVHKNHLSEIKVFYNHATISCIVKVKFDNRFVKEMTNDYMYFLINCYQSEVTVYGKSLQNVLSDKDTEITWIFENQVHKFYPDTNIMYLLSETLK